MISPLIGVEISKLRVFFASFAVFAVDLLGQSVPCCLVDSQTKKSVAKIIFLSCIVTSRRLLTMMAGLFGIFLLSMLLIWVRLNNIAIIVALINLILCVVMLLDHMTTLINIRL